MINDICEFKMLYKHVNTSFDSDDLNLINSTHRKCCIIKVL